MTTTGQWLIVHGTSGKEDFTAFALEQEGYTETFYPYDEMENPKWLQWKRRKVSFLRVGRKVPKPPQRYIRAAYVKGYTFVDIGGGDRMALVDACRRITERYEKLTLRVVAPGGIPYAVSDAVMQDMARMPDRLQEELEAAEREELRAAMERRPVVGGKAKVLAGPMSGSEILVEEIKGEWVQFTAFGGRVLAPIESVERA